MMGMCQQMMGNMMNGKGRMGMGPMGMMRGAPDKLLSAMSVKERTAFAAELLPPYARALFRGLKPEEKVQLAHALLKQMEAAFDAVAAEEDDCFMGQKAESACC